MSTFEQERVEIKQEQPNENITIKQEQVNDISMTNAEHGKFNEDLSIKEEPKVEKTENQNKKSKKEDQSLQSQPHGYGYETKYMGYLYPGYGTGYAGTFGGFGAYSNYPYPGYPAPYSGYHGSHAHNSAFDPNNTCRSLYVGNLSDKAPESLLYEIFSSLGPVEGIKIIKDKNTSESAGYGFVDYFDHYTAAIALQQLNGKVLFGHEIKVNWAFAGGQKEDTSSHFHIFVGDLTADIDDKALFNAFAPFGSISDARIMYDQTSGRSRGYGFVAFRKKEDAQRALTEMNGEWLGSRAIRCNWANQKGGGVDNTASGLDYATILTQTPQNNTTVYVGNITPDVTEHMIRQVFLEYGVIEEIKIQGDKGFAFVKFSTHESAARAIVSVSGKLIGNRAVKCSWGKERGDLLMAQVAPGIYATTYGTYSY